MNWFYWMLCWLGYKRPIFNLFFATSQERSFLSQDALCIVSVANVDEGQQFFLSLANHYDSTFSMPIEVAQQCFQSVCFGTIQMHWRVPKGLPSSLYYVECTNNGKFHWKSRLFAVVDYEFSLLDDKLVAFAPEPQWPLLVPIRCKVDFPFEVGFVANTVFKEAIPNTVARIVVGPSRRIRWPFRIPVPTKQTLNTQAQKSNELTLVFEPRRGFCTNAPFEWEIWIAFQNGMKFCLHRIGPFKPVITLESIENSPLLPWFLWMLRRPQKK